MAGVSDRLASRRRYPFGSNIDTAVILMGDHSLHGSICQPSGFGRDDGDLCGSIAPARIDMATTMAFLTIDIHAKLRADCSFELSPKIWQCWLDVQGEGWSVEAVLAHLHLLKATIVERALVFANTIVPRSRIAIYRPCFCAMGWPDGVGRRWSDQAEASGGSTLTKVGDGNS